ncbi:MAG: hypothetical protein U9P37_08520, partial [Pseudomonadota bacterium]|nr:hypothetical protein [Pseudomonadota bacterium]
MAFSDHFGLDLKPINCHFKKFLLKCSNKQLATILSHIAKPGSVPDLWSRVFVPTIFTVFGIDVMIAGTAFRAGPVADLFFQLLGDF